MRLFEALPLHLPAAVHPCTVGNLAQFSWNPGMMHWRAVKHLFQYLKGTIDYKLTYSPSSSDELFTSYTDADHAGCPDTGRSTSGYVIKMGSGAISWSSLLQSSLQPSQPVRRSSGFAICCQSLGTSIPQPPSFELTISPRFLLRKIPSTTDA